MSHHNLMSRVAFLSRRRESLHCSLNGVRIAQGADQSFMAAAIIARAHVIQQPMIDKLRAPERDVVLRTDPTHRAPRTGARVSTDAPHDADVVCTHQDCAGAPAR